MSIEIAAWWPPKVGDKLRHFTHHGAGGMKIKQVHALVYVVAVFEWEGETLATVAEWFPSRRRWSYSVINGYSDAMILYWPDGASPPDSHRRCDACGQGDQP